MKNAKPESIVTTDGLEKKTKKAIKEGLELSKKIYVLDTSVILSDAKCFEKFGVGEIILPMKVLEEVDGHKKRQDSVGINAREAIRFLDSLREKGSLSKGIKLDKTKTLVRVDSSLKDKNSERVLDTTVPDNEIIETALKIKKEHVTKKVVVVSRDINMRVKCDSIGLECEDYVREHVVDRVDEVYSGYCDLVVDDSDIDDIHNGSEYVFDQDKFPGTVLQPNQFVRMVSALDNKKSVIVRYYSHNKNLVKVKEIKDPVQNKVRPKNKEQLMALSLLLDHSIPVVTLMGTSGCGKTLLALASALSMVEKEPERYRKIIVMKPIVAVGGKDIGFLPGDKNEKLRPWLAPIYDNLEFLLDSKTQKNKQNIKTTLDYYFESGIIEVEAMTYIRGRSIANTIIIIDEAQNLNAHEIKTIMTRIGEGTKIILTGDIEQVDSPYLDNTSNGFVYLVEKMKHVDFTGHVTFRKGERSKVSAAAAELL